MTQVVDIATPTALKYRPEPTVTEKKLVQANAASRYEVTKADLPLSCPMPGMTSWNSHPRVFLPIEEKGYAKCIYCGAEYTLKDYALMQSSQQ